MNLIVFSNLGLPKKGRKTVTCIRSREKLHDLLLIIFLLFYIVYMYNLLECSYNAFTISSNAYSVH